MGDRSSMDLKLSVIETITDNFSDDKKVGSGGYGIVYKAEYNGIKMAVKKLHPLQGLDDKEFHNELLNLTTVSHKNIVRLIGYSHDIRSKYVKHNTDTFWASSMERVLCFEYMEGGNLERHIADESCELDLPTCYNIIRGTCEGLNHLHNAPKNAIFHLDLKPANILLDQSMTPKIGDLGLSKVFSSSNTHQTEILRGTAVYMPPEYIKHRLISKKFDVFSFGVVILKMLAGNAGYSRCFEMPPEDFIKLVSENWTRRLQAMPRLYSFHEIDILRVSTCAEIALRCVEEDREKRPRIEEILHELDKLEAEINIMSLTSGLSKGLTLQRSCGSNVVSVDPSWELCFHFELGKKASSCMQISNNTDGIIAFNVKMNPNKYLAVPSRGTMPPCSKHDIVVMMEAQHKEPPNLRCQDMLHVQATGVTQQQASDLDGIDNQDLFETFMAEREVNVVKLPIKYVRLSQ